MEKWRLQVRRSHYFGAREESNGGYAGFTRLPPYPPYRRGRKEWQLLRKPSTNYRSKGSPGNRSKDGRSRIRRAHSHDDPSERDEFIRFMQLPHRPVRMVVLRDVGFAGGAQSLPEGLVFCNPGHGFSKGFIFAGGND